jgi:alkanesulfonate monooxygenase SsuD/methylene tetrahydromethanopterin reductase-like flavin-dependent oxidoreductase (luciferase family)
MAEHSRRTRVGLNVTRRVARETIDLIKRAEAGGVATVWSTMNALGIDLPTVYAAAAVQTERVTLGTSIVPAFTRHPLALASQALVIENLAPGRLRLGIGTSHRPTMADAYGLEFSRPIAQLREYVQVLRTALHQGEVEFSGEYYNVNATLSAQAQTPVLLASLREHAFEMAGELSDGAISWYCPPDYLLNAAKAAMLRGAQAAGRSAPPQFAQIHVAFESAGRDREAVRAEMRAAVAGVAGAPFYAQMYAASGYPFAADGTPLDALVDQLVISGDEAAIKTGLTDLLDRGIDELVLTLMPGPDRESEENRLFALIGGL